MEQDHLGKGRLVQLSQDVRRIEVPVLVLRPMHHPTEVIRQRIMIVWRGCECDEARHQHYRANDERSIPRVNARGKGGRLMVGNEPGESNRRLRATSARVTPTEHRPTFTLLRAWKALSPSVMTTTSTPQASAAVSRASRLSCSKPPRRATATRSPKETSGKIHNE